MNITVNAFGYLNEPLAVVYGQAQQVKIKETATLKAPVKPEPVRLSAR
jgi:hypothetical protein